MNQVSTQLPQSHPSTTAFLVPWLRSARDSMILEGDTWIIRQELTISQRTAVQNLVASLKSRLACGPFDGKERLVELAKLMAAFPAFQDGETQTRLRMEAYVAALDGVPAWAVSEAREAMIKGQFGAMKYAPSPAEFASASRSRLLAAESDLSGLTRLASATVEEFQPTLEERERVVMGFDKLRKTLGAKGDDYSHEDALKSLEALRRELGLPPGILDTIPDAKERTGTFRRPASLKREDAAT